MSFVIIEQDRWDFVADMLASPVGNTKSRQLSMEVPCSFCSTPGPCVYTPHRLDSQSRRVTDSMFASCSTYYLTLRLRTSHRVLFYTHANVLSLTNTQSSASPQ